MALIDAQIVILSDTNRVYAQGSNISGQLGLSSTKTVRSFTEVRDLSNLLIISVCCAAQHTAALSNSGEVYAVGCVKYNNQCGFKPKLIEDKGYITKFRKTLFRDVVKLGCGDYCTLCLDKYGTLWGVGMDNTSHLKGQSESSFFFAHFFH